MKVINFRRFHLKGWDPLGQFLLNFAQLFCPSYNSSLYRRVGSIAASKQPIFVDICSSVLSKQFQLKTGKWKIEKWPIYEKLTPEVNPSGLHPLLKFHT